MPTPKPPTSDYVYDATLVRVIDGDTVVLSIEKIFTFDVDFGFNIKDTTSLKKSTQMHFRLYGINTPEHGTTAGDKATAALTARLSKTGVKLRVKTYKPDKYGRYLATILLTEGGKEVDVNQEMISLGHAKPYFGEGVKPV